MTEDEVRTKTLVLQVFDWDLITGDDDIGEVYLAFIYILQQFNLKLNFQKLFVQIRLPLANVDLQKGTDEWMEIEKLTNVEGQK